MNQDATSEQSASAWWRVRAIDLGLVAASAFYARYAFQTLAGIAAPGGAIPCVAMTPEETIMSCVVAVIVAASVVLSMLLTFGAGLWEAQRGATGHLPSAAQPAVRLVRDSGILLVVVAVVCAGLAVAYLPYRPAIFDVLAVFSAGASPGFLAALALWTGQSGFGLWLW
jgi:hypothetical protein